MAKNKFRADLEEELDRVQADLEMTQHDLKMANNKLNEIDMYIRGLVRGHFSLREDTALKIIKKVLCIISPELKDTLG